jgi:hypothetical protein
LTEPIRERMTSAHAIAFLALFVSLSGWAFAATIAPRNSVTSKSVKNATLKGKDVGANRLTGAQIAEGSLADVPSAASADLLDGIDSTGFVGSSEVLWAGVLSEGGNNWQVVPGANNGATSVVDGGGGGEAHVTFNRTIDACGYLATSPLDQYLISANTQDADTVRVRMRDITDSSTDDVSFTLMVVC